ncbi:hypothetical protein [Snuella lapsa]
MKPKKTLKLIIGIFVFLTLPSILFLGFMFFKYNETLPIGKSGEQADLLAHKMLTALNHEAYKNTNYIEWTYKKRRHYEWEKSKNICHVYWKEYKVSLDLNDPSNSKAFVHSFIVESDISKELITKAQSYFKRDSFWLIAPYTVFNEGTQRKVVTINNKEALLVTYTSGGLASGDSYLWFLDNNGKPKSFKMWTSVLPINGLEATWSDWTTTESGALLPTFHKLLITGLEISAIKGTL